MMRVFFAACLALLAACTPPQPPTYNEAHQIAFMDACERQGAARAFCSCMWNQITANVSFEEFTAFESLPAAERAADPLAQRLAGLAQSCAPSEGAPK